MRLLLFLITVSLGVLAAEPEFPLTPDSQPQAGIPKGTLIKGSYTAAEGSVFPGTVRDYQIYLPAAFDGTNPAPFMVFQDGVIYQAPVVFDNLIAKREIPPLVGVFIRPGVVPAAHDQALPRFNRSYEYDSVTPTYSRFLIEEFLPALEKKHGLRFSTDANDAAIAGNSSGGICAFMAAWHRPDRFRRVFTGVGTYVGIHGADRLPVLVRKIEPKPLRVFLQSGTGDNNLYCGDWWMANQMMERSLAWAGYEVNHAWGEGGHNQKHASQVFPEALRWLWRNWQTDKPVQANPKGESKWRGYEVVAGDWEMVHSTPDESPWSRRFSQMEPMADGTVWINDRADSEGTSVFLRVQPDGRVGHIDVPLPAIEAFTAAPDGELRVFVRRLGRSEAKLVRLNSAGKVLEERLVPPPGPNLDSPQPRGLCCDSSGRVFYSDRGDALIGWFNPDGRYEYKHGQDLKGSSPSALVGSSHELCLSPDQTQLYVSATGGHVAVFRLGPDPLRLERDQYFFRLDELPWGRDQGSCDATDVRAMCVDTEGRLYVATSLGVQVCDQAGRVNFIIPTPKPPEDVCFGGKDLSALFIACGDTIYKRPTKVRGIVSGQQAPIKPAPPKL